MFAIARLWEDAFAFIGGQDDDIDLLADIRGVVDKAIADKIAFKHFRENLERLLRAAAIRS